VSRFLFAAGFFAAACFAGRGSASAEELAIAPLAGKNGKVCTKTVVDIASEVATVVPWNAKKLPSTWKELSAWLDARGHDIGVSVVILGSTGKSNIVLEAYDLRRVKLIGLKSVVAGKNCKLSQAQRDLVLTFVQEMLGLEKKEGPPVALLMPDHEQQIAAVEQQQQQLSAGQELGAPPNEPPVFIQVHRRDTPPAERRGSVSAMRVGAELELAMVTRDFNFSEVRSPNLRGYGVTMPVPGLLISAHPLAEAGADFDWLAPLLIEARYRHAIAVQSSRSEGGPEYDTSYSELAVRGGWRFLIPERELAIVPALGYHRIAFSLGTADGGQREPDLPRVAYSSLELRVAAEMKVFEPLLLEGSVGYLAVLTAGEVFSDRFFSRGSAFGLELGVGARYTLMPGLAAVAGVSLRTYALSLDAEPTDLRVAGGASDTSFTLRTGIRAEM
jgi:hypothetical protein